MSLNTAAVVLEVTPGKFDVLYGCADYDLDELDVIAKEYPLEKALKIAQGEAIEYGPSVVFLGSY